MFRDCSNLKTIYTSDKFTTASVNDYDYEQERGMGSSYMFDGCRSLVGGNGTKYNESHTDKTYARIDKPGVPGYFTAKNS